jgi:uncharacterized protein YkwD
VFPPGPAAVVLLLALPSPTGPAPDPFSERVFLENINGQRAARGLSPLLLDPNLSAFARKRVEEIVAAGGADMPLVGEELHRKARASGYDPRFLGELIVEMEGQDLASVETSWAEGNTGRGMALREDIRDLGVGIGREKSGANVYVFLFGLSAGESFARRTRLLKDRAAVAREMLERVNAERRKASRRPLFVNPRLERAAQAHAEDMLARSFYGHENPDRMGPLQRAIVSGYRPAAVGENIARGEFSVEEVMEGWMASEPHRQDLLDPNYTEVGFGFAHGKNDNGYQVVWVQLFGREK